jgi:hypothetical protein
MINVNPPNYGVNILQYLLPNGHYMYCKVITICTAQWSLYIPQSDQYMYRIVVIICTAQ